MYKIHLPDLRWFIKRVEISGSSKNGFPGLCFGPCNTWGRRLLWPCWFPHQYWCMRAVICPLLLCSRSVVFNSLPPHRLQPTRLRCPCSSPGNTTGVGCCSLLHHLSVDQWFNAGLGVRSGNFSVSGRTGCLFCPNQSFLFLSNQQLCNFWICFSEASCWASLASFSKWSFVEISLWIMTEVWLLLVPLRAAFLALLSARWYTVASRKSSLECPRTLIIAKAAGKSIVCNNSWIQNCAAHPHGPVLDHPRISAAKSLQSCLTLCNPIDGSPPGSPSLGLSRQEHWSELPFPSPRHESEKWKWSRSVVSDSSDPMDCSPLGSSIHGIF